MSKHKASSSEKRNVAVVVKLLASDADPSAGGINCIYGNSLKTLTSTWTSSVAYHQEKARLVYVFLLIATRQQAQMR